jgi:hypothetical protein
MLHAEDATKVCHHTPQAVLQEVPDRQSRCSWRGKSCEVIEGEVTITSKRSRGELVPQADESLSEDKVELVEAPRGKF